jgi:Zn-dependent protease
MDDQPSFLKQMQIETLQLPARHATHAAVRQEFYKVDYRKISLREYWNLSPNWKGIVAWLLKFVGSPLQGQHAHPHPAVLKQYEVAEQHLPTEAATAIAPVRREIERMGFHSPKWIHTPPLRSNVATTAATFSHTSGQVVARILYARATSPPSDIVRLHVVFVTLLKDGWQLLTTNMRPSFRGPPMIVVKRMLHAGASQLYELHQRRLAKIRPEQIRKLETLAERDAFVDACEMEAYEFQVRRGLYVPVTEGEFPQCKPETRPAAAIPPPLPPRTGRYAEVLSEIDRIQNSKASWASTLALLAVSAAIFIAIGGTRWSWETVGILVGVLFLHETGHYLAMRAFDYQNVRMFFIPLLGAAVSGRNYNVKGWQKVIVSLAGPVPGIAAGALLGLFAIATGHSLATKIALMALLVNGINLLPILPLDGGWVMHAIVFCRRSWLEGVFYILAGVVMVGYSFAGGEKLWMYFGILMLLTSPAVFRTAHVAHRLRARGVSAISADQRTIPPETAETIIDEIKSSFPGARTDKTLAALTLNIFEKLNSTAPSLGASVLLLAAYIGSLLFALVFVGLVFVARSDLAGSGQPTTSAATETHADR